MNEGQSRRWSVVEALTHDITGWLLHTAERAVIFWFLALHVTIRENLAMGIVFLISGALRGYGIRRLFNWWNFRSVKEIANGREP